MMFRKAAFLSNVLASYTLPKMTQNTEIRFQMRKTNCFLEQVVLEHRERVLDFILSSEQELGRKWLWLYHYLIIIIT